MKIGDKVKCIKQDASLIVGDIYTVTGIEGRDQGWDRMVIRISGLWGPYYPEFFEQLDNLEDKIKLANSYLGKKFLGHTIDNVCVVCNIEQARLLNVASSFVQLALKENAPLVVVSSLKGNVSLPLEKVVLDEEYEEVELNDTYTAKVYKDKIEVGCQTFPISILDALYDAHEKIC
jgi:hypothetical protein